MKPPLRVTRHNNRLEQVATPSDIPVAPSDIPVAPSDIPVAPSDIPVAPSDIAVAPSASIPVGEI